jgi:ribokinase
MITVAADGANTIVVAPGANGRLTPEFIDAAGYLFADTCMLICQLEVPLVVRSNTRSSKATAG